MCVFALVLATAPALTAQQADDKPATASAASSIKGTSQTGLYDVDASGLDIRLVLEMLARRSGVNIVVSPEVTGQINAHLKQMPVESILQHLSLVQGFKYEKDGTTYLVGVKEEPAKAEPPAPAPPPVPEILVWECRHVTPAEMVKAVKELFPSVKAAEGPGVITPKLGAVASAVGDATGATPTATSSQDDSAKQTATRIVLVGSPDELARVRGMLERLDAPRGQVEIQVAITEINSSGSQELGLKWSWSDIALKETPDGGIGFGKFSKEGVTVNAALSALIKDGQAKLLAQPKVSVLDSETAEILIGERLLFPKLVGYNQVGAPIYDKSEERVGIYLQIAPKIAGDDEIVMTLYPQVSLVTQFLKTSAGDYPQISTREARTTVSVKSGETLVIGGLLRDNEISDASKVPILGDLPIIGHLFRHTKKTKERTEIVILLSPKITQ